MSRPRICLNMIMRDESPVVRRCLASVRPFIDHWVIVDTGSRDGTPDIVRRELETVAGALHERPWKNFSHNRSEALALAEGKGDYLLFMDADQILAAAPEFHWPALDADVYRIECGAGEMTYGRDALVRSSLDWRWEGVVHEYLACGRDVRHGSLAGLRLVDMHDGVRSRELETYARDAALLEEALATAPDDPRSVFYLAQSYRDAGELEKSRDTYRRRAALGGWAEEVWFSLYEAARLAERCGVQPSEIAAGYLAAFQYRPRRAEPLVQLARFHRGRGEHALAFLYAHHAAALPRPADDLFVEESVYRWRALDELSINAYYIGAYGIGHAAVRRLLENGVVLPAADRERIVANARFYTAGDPSDRRQMSAG